MEKLMTTFPTLVQTGQEMSGQGTFSSQEKGFTLVEVLIVTFILAVAILGMESLQLYAINQIQRSDDLGTTTALAQDVMETLRTVDFDNLADGAYTHPVTDNVYHSYTMSPSEKDKWRGRGTNDYYISWRVKPDPGGSADMVYVDVVIRYTKPGFEDTTVDLFDPYVDVSEVNGVGEYMVNSIICRF